MEKRIKGLQDLLSIQKIFGIILLMPPAVTGFLFLINVFFEDPGSIPKLSNLNVTWFARSKFFGMENTLLFLGILAMCGAYLLKNSERKNS